MHSNTAKYPESIRINDFSVKWDDYYLVSTLTKGLGVGARTIRNAIKRNDFQAVDFGKGLKVHGASIIVYFTERSTNAKNCGKGGA